jgi:glutamine amidotransferase
MQMLFLRSFEDGEYAGLDVLKGDVVRFGDVPGLKVPHMGWNQLRHRRPDCPLIRDVPDGAHVYFVHSYFAKPANQDVIASAAEYPDPFAAVVWRDNVMATQFHPEKSQQVGQTMLRNFAVL